MSGVVLEGSHPVLSQHDRKMFHLIDTSVTCQLYRSHHTPPNVFCKTIQKYFPTSSSRVLLLLQYEETGLLEIVTSI